MEVLRDPFKRAMFDKHGTIFDMDQNQSEVFVSEKMEEIINLWIDSQMASMKKSNISKFFTHQLQNSEGECERTLHELKKAKTFLESRMLEVTSDGPTNKVQELLQGHINSAHTKIVDIENKLILLGLIKVQCKTYNSIEDVEPSPLSSGYILYGVGNSYV